jgi:uncharacterized protein
MQFVIIGLDGKDKQAPARRQAFREQHIKRGDELRASGNLWYGAVLLYEDGSMKGSMYVVSFPSDKELQEWLSEEPYVVGDVWRDIKIHKSNTREPWRFSHPKEWFESQE